MKVTWGIADVVPGLKVVNDQDLEYMVGKYVSKGNEPQWIIIALATGTAYQLNKADEKGVVEFLNAANHYPVK
jgi:hypothetical protein